MREASELLIKCVHTSNKSIWYYLFSVKRLLITTMLEMIRDSSKIIAHFYPRDSTVATDFMRACAIRLQSNLNCLDFIPLFTRSGVLFAPLAKKMPLEFVSASNVPLQCMPNMASTCYEAVAHAALWGIASRNGFFNISPSGRSMAINSSVETSASTFRPRLRITWILSACRYVNINKH